MAVWTCWENVQVHVCMVAGSYGGTRGQFRLGEAVVSMYMCVQPGCEGQHTRPCVCEVCVDVCMDDHVCMCTKVTSGSMSLCRVAVKS